MQTAGALLILLSIAVAALFALGAFPLLTYLGDRRVRWHSVLLWVAAIACMVWWTEASYDAGVLADETQTAGDITSTSHILLIAVLFSIASVLPQLRGRRFGSVR